jgi:predicted signal transduction protein with EAL and GGDEF domain
MRSSRLTGMIVSLFTEDRPDGHTEQTLLESWGRFASLAVERRGLYEQLSFRAQYDSLTALLNRAALYDRVDSLIRGNSAVRSPMAVVYLDLDGFKQINDTHGHGAGDKSTVAASYGSELASESVYIPLMATIPTHY